MQMGGAGPGDALDLDTGTTVACDLDGEPGGKLRRLVREILAGHSGAVVDDAVLVADELASNACQHGLASRTSRLTLVNRGRALLIEVDDAGSGQPQIRRPDRTGGRGLVLVDRLASRWGVRRHPRHKTVWAEMTLMGLRANRNVPHLTLA